MLLSRSGLGRSGQWRPDPRGYELLSEMATVGAVGGHAVGLLGFVQTKESGVDNFVLMHQGGAGKCLAFEAVVGAIADRRDLAHFGGGDFIKERPGAGGDRIYG